MRSFLQILTIFYLLCVTCTKTGSFSTTNSCGERISSDHSAENSITATPISTWNRELSRGDVGVQVPSSPTPAVEDSIGVQPSTDNSENQSAKGYDDDKASQVTRTSNYKDTAMIAIAVDDCEQIDLKEHEGYHQRITGAEAERRLGRCEEPCYLVRYSTKKNCYILSIYKHQRPFNPVTMHFQIIVVKESKSYKILGKKREFKTIHDLLEHYKCSRIDPGFAKIGVPYTETQYSQALEQEERQRQEEDRQRRAEEQRQEEDRQRREEEQRQEEDRRRREEEQRRRRKCTIL